MICGLSYNGVAQQSFNPKWNKYMLYMFSLNNIFAWMQLWVPQLTEQEADA